MIERRMTIRVLRFAVPVRIIRTTPDVANTTEATITISSQATESTPAIARPVPVPVTAPTPRATPNHPLFQSGAFVTDVQGIPDRPHPRCSGGTSDGFGRSLADAAGRLGQPRDAAISAARVVDAVPDSTIARARSIPSSNDDATSAATIAEAAFKAVARALRIAVETDPRKSDAVPSTKGTL